MTDTQVGAEVDALETVRRATRHEGEPERMMPAEAYTAPVILAWEQRHLVAGSWSCLGRYVDLFPPVTEGRPVTQRSVRVGDVSALLVRHRDNPRMFANTCRHRGHELLGEGETSQRQSIICPYHAWSYDLGVR